MCGVMVQSSVIDRGGIKRWIKLGYYPLKTQVPNAAVMWWLEMTTRLQALLS